MLPKQIPFHVEAALVLALSLVHLLLLSMQLYIINSTIIENQMETHRVLSKVMADNERSKELIEDIHAFANRHEAQLGIKQFIEGQRDENSRHE